MTTPTRRISFYLKPAVVKSEREACSYLDSLPASERSRAQRAAFLAGLALIKRTPRWRIRWQNGQKTKYGCHRYQYSLKNRRNQQQTTPPICSR